MLEEEADLTGDFVAHVSEDSSDAEEDRRVSVVPARVHDTFGPRDEVEGVLLLDRERVDIGPQRDGRACGRTS